MLEAEKLCLDDERKLLQQNKVLKSMQFVQYYKVMLYSLASLPSDTKLHWTNLTQMDNVDTGLETWM